jgi:acyl carrier protein
MNIESLKTEIKALLETELDLSTQQVEIMTDDAVLFGEGVGLDSLDALQIAMSIEERFGVKIPEDESARPIFANIQSLADYVFAHHRTSDDEEKSA